MRKKFILFTIIIVSIIMVIIVINNNLNNDYTVKIKMIDSFSPERSLEVYKNDKLINYKKIQYKDSENILCYSANPTVAYVDLIDIEELVIVLKNNKKVIAKIIKN